LRLRFLGTGTSFGIPVIGCRCAACTSENPRDRRTRSGALLELAAGRLLIDAPPELRLQLIEAQVAHVAAVWITHTHADHVHGLDDLRIFSLRGGREVPLHLHEAHAKELVDRFAYVFDPSVRPLPGTSKPRLVPCPFDATRAISLLGETFVPLEVPHGATQVFGFRVGSLGYVTDAKALPDEALRRLAGVETLVLNALWFGDPHPTHFNIEEAVDAARQVGARRTYLTHLTHRVRHEEVAAWLPEGIMPAYDGLVVDC